MMFLDTSGLLCVHNRPDRQHLVAKQLFDAAVSPCTHSYVLAELIPLAASRRLPRQAALDFIEDVQDSQIIDVIYIDENLHRRGLELLNRRLDKDWSLCDAVSFIVMQHRGITEALTTDHHFEQAGFVRLLKP